jgi:hypothetical protein
MVRMKSNEQLIPVENLRKFTNFLTMDGRQFWDSTQQDVLLQAIADSERTTYIGCIAEAFGIKHPQVFSIGELVKIIALPSAVYLDQVGEDIRSFASSYGYVAVVSGRGLFGGDVYFVARGAIALASAAETFTKLKLLGTAN